MKKAVHNHKAFWALLTDLSKTFDCIYHDLLIAKLNADGLSLPALKLITNYLQNQKQRTKIGSIYSDWEDIISELPQGSIPGHVTYFLEMKIIILQITLITPSHTPLSIRISIWYY